MDAEVRCRGCGKPTETGQLAEGVCSSCRERNGSSDAMMLMSREVTIALGPVSTAGLSALAETWAGVPTVLLDLAGDANDESASATKPRSDDLSAALRERLGSFAQVGLGVTDEAEGRDVDSADDDRESFFLLRLDRGRTLASLLGTRNQTTEDQSRFLGIFEQVCRTMAHAHARGVVHRNLTSASVRIGRGGDVQILDWEESRLLFPQAKPETRNGLVTPATGTGRGGGTPANGTKSGRNPVTPPPTSEPKAPPPGDDPRTDVRALGSILCEILTGEPASDSLPTGSLFQVSHGDSAEHDDRLDHCEAPPDLVELTKDCLAADPQARPRDAGAVLERLKPCLTGDEDRRLVVERDAARLARKRRWRQVGLATSAAGLGLFLLGNWWIGSLVRQAEAVATRNAVALSKVGLLVAQARAHPEEPGRWNEAAASLEDAEKVLGNVIDDSVRKPLTALRAEVQHGSQAARFDRILLSMLSDIRSARDDIGSDGTEAAYLATFREAGIDIETLSPEQAAALLKTKPRVVLAELAAYLDDWSRVRRAFRQPAERWRKHLALARLIDPSTFRNMVRDALQFDDPAARRKGLLALADKIRPALNDPRRANVPPAADAVLLAAELDGAGETERAVAILRQAAGRHPGDVWASFDLAGDLDRLNPPRRDEATRYYAAARALRPETGHTLAHRLELSGRVDEAEAIFRDLVDRLPNDSRHLSCYGVLLRKRGETETAQAILDRAIASANAVIRLRSDDITARMNLGVALLATGEWDGAINAFREVTRRRPNEVEAHLRLSRALQGKGRHDDAITVSRAVVQLRPSSSEAQTNLGRALQAKGQLDEALTAHREAVRLNANDAEAQSGLGAALMAKGRLDEAIVVYRQLCRLVPDDPTAQSHLGLALQAKGRLDDAVTAFREAIRIKPEFAEAHANLGQALQAQDRLDEAIAAFREAIRLEPGSSLAHSRLGTVFRTKGRLDDAIEEFRAAVKAQPDNAEARFHLASALQAKGRLDDAVTSYEEAIRLKPDYPEALIGIGFVLKSQGRFSDALDYLRKGHASGSQRPDWSYPSAEWVKECERHVSLESRLQAILRGEDRPADTAERIEFAKMTHAKRHYALSARLFTKALNDQPSLGDDRRGQVRYRAACAAAMAAIGLGDDDPPPNETARILFRRQALDWLRSERDAWAQRLAAGNSRDREEALQALDGWKSDPDLAGFRDSANLELLSDAERKAWQTLWADVDGLLARARVGSP